MRKIFLGLKSFILYLVYKIYFKNKIQLSVINSVKGKLKITLNKKSKLFIGEFLMIKGPVYFECERNAILKIGNHCFFNRNCSITSNKSIQIGNNCMFANNLVIVDHDHKVIDDIPSVELVSNEIIIGNNVWVGANVTILKGVKIGNNTIIAAGAVVNKNCDPYSVYAGIPARKVKNLKY